MVQQPYRTPWTQSPRETADMLDMAHSGVRVADAILAMSPDRGAAAYATFKQYVNGVLERLGPAPTVTISVPELPSRTF